MLISNTLPSLSTYLEYKIMDHTRITYEDIQDPNNLLKSAKRCMKGVKWKFSTQAYYLERMQRVTETAVKLREHQRMSEGFICFPINERGKRRDIKSVHINERVTQKCLVDQALSKRVVPRLIYDNYATLKDRGQALAVERIKRFLHEYYREHGTNKGYISIWDIHNYFGSIRHEDLYQEYGLIFSDDPRIVDLTMDFIDAFGDVGLGLGSEVSQISAALIQSRTVDHYIKENLHCPWYGRYNDDAFIIHNDLSELHEYDRLIREKYSRLNIECNEKKSHIFRIDKGFKILKLKIKLTETGKVIVRPNRKNITRERSKLKKLKALYDSGKITFYECAQQYGSWRGELNRLNSYKTLHRMDKLFENLFGKEWRTKHGKRKREYHIEQWIKPDTEFRPVNYPRRQAPAPRRNYTGGCA